MKLLTLAVAGLLSFSGPAAYALEPSAHDPKEIEAGLQWKQGDVTLGDNLATLKVSSRFRYLSPADTSKVLVGIWNNPVSQATGTLGMLFRSDINPTDDGSWGVIITYRPDGFIKDNDAAKINYDDLLTEMKKQAEEGNTERAKEGFPPIKLIGWAARPFYDKVNRKLRWAKELQFGDNPDHTLNYNVRVLGRKGVLVLNGVALMSDFQQIDAQMPSIISMVEFNKGNRYTDFSPGVDKVAEYGLAALVVGGIAAKAGLLKGLIALLAVGWKFVAMAIIGIGAFFTKTFRRKREP